MENLASINFSGYFTKAFLGKVAVAGAVAVGTYKLLDVAAKKIAANQYINAKIAAYPKLQALKARVNPFLETKKGQYAVIAGKCVVSAVVGFASANKVIAAAKVVLSAAIANPVAAVAVVAVAIAVGAVYVAYQAKKNEKAVLAGKQADQTTITSLKGQLATAQATVITDKERAELARVKTELATVSGTATVLAGYVQNLYARVAGSEQYKSFAAELKAVLNKAGLAVA
jgi:hypothetical protein